MCACLIKGRLTSTCIHDGSYEISQERSCIQLFASKLGAQNSLSFLPLLKSDNGVFAPSCIENGPTFGNPASFPLSGASRARICFSCFLPLLRLSQDVVPPLGDAIIQGQKEKGGKEGRTGCFGWRRDTFALSPSFQGAREEGDSVPPQGDSPLNKRLVHPLFSMRLARFLSPREELPVTGEQEMETVHRFKQKHYDREKKRKHGAISLLYPPQRARTGMSPE